MQRRSFILIAFFLFAHAHAQQPKFSTVARIAFWNAENLFDTIDDPRTNDAEFLPNGKMKWTSDRHNTKINHLAKVILAIGNDGKGPDILGLSEIENETVLVDLTQKTDLKKQDYGIVHYDSPDRRGIDVALLYKKGKFKVIASKAVPVHLTPDTLFTRDILVVEGVLAKDTIYICVNHWPSRRGGKDSSEVRRITAAATLLMIEDSIMRKNNGAKILAIGDFNDEPFDKSILSLGCNTPACTQDTGLCVCFTDLMDSLKAAGDGSFYFKSEKDMIDQFLVNEQLRWGYGIQIQHAYIFRPDWITGISYKNDPPGPLHTYAGKKYIGGYSDHYPVYADVIKQK